MKKLSQEEVINRLINKRGTENFDYSKVIYINIRTPIEIFCKKHNKTFSAYTESFIDFRKIGCKECKKETLRNKKRKSLDKFVSDAKEIHGDKYDYSLVEYKNSKTKITIKCNTCNNIFNQTPNDHLSKKGCKECKKELYTSLFL